MSARLSTPLAAPFAVTRHWPSQLDDRATTAQSLLGHAPPSKTIRGDLPEAGLHLALRRARSEYWCPTPPWCWFQTQCSRRGGPSSWHSNVPHAQANGRRRRRRGGCRGPIRTSDRSVAIRYLARVTRRAHSDRMFGRTRDSKRSAVSLASSIQPNRRSGAGRPGHSALTSWDTRRRRGPGRGPGGPWDAEEQFH